VDAEDICIEAGSRSAIVAKAVATLTEEGWEEVEELGGRATGTIHTATLRQSDVVVTPRLRTVAGVVATSSLHLLFEAALEATVALSSRRRRLFEVEETVATSSRHLLFEAGVAAVRSSRHHRLPQAEVEATVALSSQRLSVAELVEVGGIVALSI